jgi:hypothetical protein
MAFDRLLFGTAGVPNSTLKKNNPVEGVKRIHELLISSGRPMVCCQRLAWV